MSTPAGQETEAVAAPPTEKAPSTLGLVLAAIVGAEFMLQLDGTIVNVALPGMQRELTLGVTAASWVLNGFFLAFGGLLLLAGRLGDVLGHRRVFLVGIGIVTLASLVAGFANSEAMLLTGRIVQGAGAAVAGPAGLALLAILFQGERQQRAFGLYSTVTGLGAAAGLVLGGVLTQVGSWRWSLLVNVPIGLVIIAIGLKELGFGRDATRARSLGVPSAVLVTAAFTAGVYGLVRAADKGWSDPVTLGAFAAFVVLVVALLVVDARAAEPLLPGRIFADRDRIGGFVNLVLLAAVLTGFLFYIAQYLATVRHLNPLRTGLAILPFGLAILLATQVLGKLVTSVTLKARGLGGLVLVAIAIALLTRLNGTSNYWVDVLPEIVLLGIGVGLAIVPFNMVILSTSDPADTGITAGILQTSLTVGGALGLALFLLPYTSGSGNPADTISSVFAWSTGIAVLGLLVTVVFWFGPRRTLRPAG